MGLFNTIWAKLRFLYDIHKKFEVLLVRKRMQP